MVAPNSDRTVFGLEHTVTDNGWDTTRRERLVKNEMTFRDYNNRRVEIEQRADVLAVEIALVKRPVLV